MNNFKHVDIYHQVIELRKKGLTNEEIGKKVNRSRMTINSIFCNLKSHGWDIPPAPRYKPQDFDIGEFIEELDVKMKHRRRYESR